MAGFFFQFPAWAENEGFNFGDDLDSRELKAISEFLGAASIIHQVRAPAYIGDDELWGVELGIQASLLSSNKINELLEGTGSKIPAVPGMAFIHGRVYIPDSYVVEIAFFPKIDKTIFRFEAGGLGFRWLYGNFFKLPIDADVRVHFSSSKFHFEEQGTKASVSFFGYGLTSSVGYTLPFLKIFTFRPYVGMGILGVGGDFSASSDIPGLLAGGESKLKYNSPLFHLQIGLDQQIWYGHIVFEYNLVGLTHKFTLSLMASIPDI